VVHPSVGSSCHGRRRYPGRAAVPKSSHPGRSATIRRVSHSFRFLIGWRYWPDHVGRVRRRGTFTGQCHQPLYSSETARHPHGPSVITGHRRMKKDRVFPGLRAGFGASSPMLAETRFPSELNFTWPLRHHPLLGNAGCVPLRLFGPQPRSSLVLESSSKVFQTGADPPG
jgi:hypothetical protein